MHYFSQYGQDRWLADLVFQGKRGGVFAEIGALDGVLHSNSLFFEKTLGWTGMLAEPQPDLAAQCRKMRPACDVIQAAISNHNGVAEFCAISGALVGWSGLVDSLEDEHRARIIGAIPAEARKTISVPCMTLAEALDHCGIAHVDYLSVDVEGAEGAIFSIFPFDCFDIDVIGVENNWMKPDVENILSKAGYRKLTRIGVDDFYRRAS